MDMGGYSQWEKEGFENFSRIVWKKKNYFFI